MTVRHIALPVAMHGKLKPVTLLDMIHDSCLDSVSPLVVKQLVWSAHYLKQLRAKLLITQTESL